VVGKTSCRSTRAATPKGLPATNGLCSKRAILKPINTTFLVVGLSFRMDAHMKKAAVERSFFLWTPLLQLALEQKQSYDQLLILDTDALLYNTTSL
jgi:hypothetical protein